MMTVVAQPESRLTNGKVDWPKYPKFGDEFSYTCPLSGCDYVFMRWIGKKWYQFDPHTEHAQAAKAALAFRDRVDLNELERVSKSLDLLFSGSRKYARDDHQWNVHLKECVEKLQSITSKAFSE